MLEEYNTVAKQGEMEIVEKKSRFIATARHASSEEEAKMFVEEVKKKYCDAKHNAFAYCVGLEQEMQRQSDDKEPAGTAGLPVLQAITGLSLKNTAVVVTRYFGGTLLGTGGLVRAYGKAAKAALLEADVVKKQLYRKFLLTVDYSLSGKLRYEIEDGGFLLQDIVYTNQVAFSVLAEFACGDSFVAKMTEAARGKLSIKEEASFYGTCCNGELTNDIFRAKIF